MRTLIITRNFPPSICGVGDYSKELMERLPGYSVDPFILTLKNNEVEDYSLQKNWDNKVLPVADRFSFGIYKNIINVCREKNIRQIFWQYVPYSFSSSGMPFYLPIVMFLLRLKGIRQVVYFHEVSLRAWHYGLKQFLIAINQQAIGKLIAAVSNSNITSIGFYQKYLWPFKSHIVPVGANIYITETRRSQIISPAKQVPVIFCFANRVDVVLGQAIAELHAKNNLCQLEIAGKCTEETKQQIQSWIHEYGIADRVIWKGELSMSELAAVIAESDIFFQPQTFHRKQEGGVSAKNGTIIAAMGLGKTVICTCGDMTDTSIFQDEVNVIFVDAGNKESYYNALAKVLENPGQYSSLGQSALRTYEQKFAWDVVVQAISKHLKKDNNISPVIIKEVLCQ